MAESSDRARAVRDGAVPALRRVLAPTDLSELGKRAVPYAYAMLGDGGIVHLVHVIEPLAVPNPLYAHYSPTRAPTPEERAAQEAALVEALQQLVPPDARRRRIETHCEVVESADVPDAICELAQRHDVDVICLGTHGRSGFTRALLGSVAQRVMERTTRPMLLVQIPRE